MDLIQMDSIPSQYSRLSDYLIQSVDVTRYYDGYEFYDRNLTEGKFYFSNGYVSFHPGDSLDYSAIITDYRGSARVVMTFDSTLTTSNIVQANSYYPSGALVTDVQTFIQLGSSSGDVQTHKFTGKELDRMYGLDWYDLGARRYDAAAGTFWSMDPLAEQYYHISPYSYCAADPVNKIDPDGQRIFIKGNHAEDALSQIQARTGNKIQLSINDDGSLSYRNESGKKLRRYSKQVAAIIDNTTIDVIMNTMDSYKTSTGLDFIGGAFMGNTVEKDEEGNVIKVITNQEINTEVLSKADTYERKGTAIMHELTESYEGGKIAWETGKSILSSDKDYKTFRKAHNSATHQPQDMGRRYIGFDGRLVTDKAQALKEEFYVKPSLNSDEETIILTIPL